MADVFRSLQLQQYHQLFLSERKRADGRSLRQFRDIDVTIGPVESADGSCCARFGNSSVICGSKLLIQAPEPGDPAAGLLEVTVKLPPNSLYKYKWSKDAYADEEQVMALQIRNILLSSKCVDLRQLVINPGSDVWLLSLEVICLDFDGSIMDVSVAAIMGCLMSTTVPVVLTKQEDSREGEHFTFTDERKPLHLNSFPISSTYAVMSPEITIADPTVEEEILSSGIVNIVIDHPDKRVVRLHKEHGIPVSEELVSELIDDAESRVDQVLKVLQKQAKDEPRVR